MVVLQQQSQSGRALVAVNRWSDYTRGWWRRLVSVAESRHEHWQRNGSLRPNLSRVDNLRRRGGSPCCRCCRIFAPFVPWLKERRLPMSQCHGRARELEVTNEAFGISSSVKLLDSPDGRRRPGCHRANVDIGMSRRRIFQALLTGIRTNSLGRYAAPRNQRLDC